MTTQVTVDKMAATIGYLTLENNELKRENAELQRLNEELSKRVNQPPASAK